MLSSQNWNAARQFFFSRKFSFEIQFFLILIHHKKGVVLKICAISKNIFFLNCGQLKNIYLFRNLQVFFFRFQDGREYLLPGYDSNRETGSSEVIRRSSNRSSNQFNYQLNDQIIG